MYGTSGEIYNICSGKGVSLKTMINLIAESLKIEVKTKINEGSEFVITIPSKQYLLSFIKNESENIPLKIKAILKSMIEKTGVPIFPKRDYKYSDFVENLLNEKTKSCKKI